MKKGFASLFAALLALLLTACGAAPAAQRGTSGGAPTVSQIMENAEKDEPSPPPSDADATLPPAQSEELPEAAEPQEEPPSADGVDIDLTQMNATMVFAEVSNIMYMPDDYIGSIIRMNGMAVSSTDAETGSTYRAVIIQDATACCASGLDYVLAEGQDYPPDETDVIVTGEFELYEEAGALYARLRDAVLSA